MLTGGRLDAIDAGERRVDATLGAVRSQPPAEIGRTDAPRRSTFSRCRCAVGARRSIPPEFVEALGVHHRIARRVGDLAMAEIRGQGSRIHAIVDQLEAGSVSQ